MRDLEERIVSFLPLSHVAANTTDIFVMISCLGTVYFADKNALKVSLRRGRRRPLMLRANNRTHAHSFPFSHPQGSLVDTLKSAKPTLFLGVPRVWEKFHEKMMETARSSKGLKRQIALWAKWEGFRHNETALRRHCYDEQTPVTLAYRLADKIVFQKVKRALGLDACKRFYSAAAPLSRELLDYFLSLDIRIMEIYGMSE